MSATVYVSAGITAPNYYVDRLPDGKPFTIVRLAERGLPYISTRNPGDLRALAEVLTAAADALAGALAEDAGAAPEVTS